MLVAIAKRLTKYLKESDLVSRLGGDEFLVLLEEYKDITDVVQVAEGIIEDCKTPLIIDDHQIFTSISIGIVLGNHHYQQGADLIRDSDIAMYCAKTEARSSYKFFDAEMHSRAIKRLTLEADLRSAISRNELVIHYQPVVDLSTDKLFGFEALVRWQHPMNGLISPDEFIPIAEEVGLIISLDDWVLNQACQQMVLWQRQFPHLSTLKIGVNLSAQDLCKSHLIERLNRVLASTGLKEDSLVLEITESMLIDDIDRTTALLGQLASRNIRISIDDFGTGYSSLNYLNRLPVHSLKVDRSFVSQMQEGNRNYQVVKTILSLSRQLGLTAVAEGIETTYQMQQLQSLGCQLGQGYFFAKPLTAADTEAYMRQNFRE